MEGVIITFLILIMFFCAVGRTTETFREHKKGRKKYWKKNPPKNYSECVRKCYDTANPRKHGQYRHDVCTNECGRNFRR